jgi:hypothetical protein
MPLIFNEYVKEIKEKVRSLSELEDKHNLERDMICMMDRLRKD